MAKIETARPAIGAQASSRWATRLGRVLERVPSADRLTIAALLLVVALVSVPLLRTHALRQNEEDALRSLALLAGPLATLAQGGRAPATIGHLLELEPDLARRLIDAELLDGGRLLRRHGYLFDLAPPLPHAAGRGPILRAWPWSRGRTGLGAFVQAAEGELFGHPNREGLWSGPNPPPRPGDEFRPAVGGGAPDTWRRLRPGRAE